MGSPGSRTWVAQPQEVANKASTSGCPYTGHPSTSDLLSPSRRPQFENLGYPETVAHAVLPPPPSPLPPRANRLLSRRRRGDVLRELSARQHARQRADRARRGRLPRADLHAAEDRRADRRRAEGLLRRGERLLEERVAVSSGGRRSGSIGCSTSRGCPQPGHQRRVERRPGEARRADRVDAPRRRGPSGVAARSPGRLARRRGEARRRAPVELDAAGHGPADQASAAARRSSAH